MPYASDPIPCRCRQCSQSGLLQNRRTAAKHIELQEREDRRLLDQEGLLGTASGGPGLPSASRAGDETHHSAASEPIQEDLPPPAASDSDADVPVHRPSNFEGLIATLAMEPAMNSHDPGEDNFDEPFYAGRNADGDADDFTGTREALETARAAPPDLDYDNLHRTRDAIFDDEGQDGAFAAEEDGADNEEFLPEAFEEDDIVRNIYIRTFIQSAFHHATHEDAARMLKDQRASLLALASRESIDLDLDEMAITLRTVERRLGVSVDEHITYYIICPICWDRHHPSTLPLLDSPNCIKADCPGILYTVSPRKTGQKRIPSKILPYSSLEGYIRRMFLRPGKAEEVESWRKADDHGRKAPQTAAEWRAHLADDVPLNDIHDGSAWRAVQAGLTRRSYPQEATVRDEDVQQGNLRFVSMPLALLLTMNIDWFQPMSTRTHSSGAIYFVVNNLPRAIRNLRENTFLVCVLPGPTEPSKEQMNSILDLVRDEFLNLSRGIKVTVLETTNGITSPVRRHIWAELFLNCSDGPARAKANGTASCNCHDHTCTECYATFLSLVDPDTYDPSNFRPRDPNEQVFWKLMAKNATDNQREIIFNRRGVRYSALDDMPNWFAPAHSPPEPMHAVVLGDTAFIHKEILTALGMFNAFPRAREPADQPLAKFQACLQRAWWPAWVARVPTGVHQGSKIKADQWRNLLPIYLVALYEAWAVDGAIPDTDAPKAKSNANVTRSTSRIEKRAATRRMQYVSANVAVYDTDYRDAAIVQAQEGEGISRNYRQHYDAVANFVAGASILLRQAISLSDADRAERYFGRSFRAFAQMGCPLTPNFHATMHLKDKVEKYGPVYGWWAYAFERMNGIVGSFNLNGRGGGEVEATMLRGWLKTIQIQDLLRHMQALENKTEDDLYTIDRLLEAVAGGAEGKRARGTFLSYIATLGLVADQEQLVLPKHYSDVAFDQDEIYPSLLSFARQIRPGDHIISGHLLAQPEQSKLGFKGRSFPTIIYKGIKYGSYAHFRGCKVSFAYVFGRNAARIEAIYELQIDGKPPLYCCVVRPFIRAAVPDLPWHLYAPDVGIDVWEVELGDRHMVTLDDLSGHFGWVPITIQQKEVHVTFSLDHRMQEPDIVA